MPRVSHDDRGVPHADADGALVLDGAVSKDDPDPLDCLRNLAAFADALFAVALVEG